MHELTKKALDTFGDDQKSLDLFSDLLKAMHNMSQRKITAGDWKRKNNPELFKD
jgi:hypothetical protein